MSLDVNVNADTKNAVAELIKARDAFEAAKEAAKKLEGATGELGTAMRGEAEVAVRNAAKAVGEAEGKLKKLTDGTSSAQQSWQRRGSWHRRRSCTRCARCGSGSAGS